MTITRTWCSDILAHQLDGYAATSDGYAIDLARAYSLQLVSSAANNPTSCTVTVSSSNDGVNWAALSANNVTTNATSFLAIPSTPAKFIRVAKAISSGAVKVKVLLFIQSEQT